MHIVPCGSGPGILVDDDGEAWDIATGYPARPIPDGTRGSVTFTNCWIIKAPPPEDAGPCFSCGLPPGLPSHDGEVKCCDHCMHPTRPGLPPPPGYPSTPPEPQ